MIWDAAQDVREPGAWIDAIQLGRNDQGVDGGSALSAAVQVAEKPSLGTPGNTAQRSFRRIAQKAEPAERISALLHVVPGPFGVGIPEHPGPCGRHLGFQVRHEGPDPLLPHGQALLGRLAGNHTLRVEDRVDPRNCFRRLAGWASSNSLRPWAQQPASVMGPILRVGR
jgi:hypothetical protein